MMLQWALASLHQEWVDWGVVSVALEMSLPVVYHRVVMGVAPQCRWVGWVDASWVGEGDRLLLLGHLGY